MEIIFGRVWSMNGNKSLFRMHYVTSVNFNTFFDIILRAAIIYIMQCDVGVAVFCHSEDLNIF